MNTQEKPKLLAGCILLYNPLGLVYNVFFTGGSNKTGHWIAGDIKGQHTFTKEEFKTLKTEKIARALYAYKGD